MANRKTIGMYLIYLGSTSTFFATTLFQENEVIMWTLLALGVVMPLTGAFLKIK